MKVQRFSVAPVQGGQPTSQPGSKILYFLQACKMEELHWHGGLISVLTQRHRFPIAIIMWPPPDAPTASTIRHYHVFPQNIPSFIIIYFFQMFYHSNKTHKIQEIDTE